MLLSYTIQTKVTLLETEVFKPCYFSKYYLVSNFGRVFSTISRKLLVQAMPNRGPYMQVKLHSKTYNVHSLIIRTFKNDEHFAYAMTDHIDGNPLNNHISNLEWVTNQENQLRAYKLGKYKKLSKQAQALSNIKVGNSKQKLTTKQVKQIQKDLMNFIPSKNTLLEDRQHRLRIVKNLALTYNISISVINRIAKKEGRYAV